VVNKLHRKLNTRTRTHTHTHYRSKLPSLLLFVLIYLHVKLPMAMQAFEKRHCVPKADYRSTNGQTTTFLDQMVQQNSVSKHVKGL
jgi:hypothetical protein